MSVDPLQPDPILQRRLVGPPWERPRGTRLPGTGPAAADGWLMVDDAFAPQMALRERSLSERRDRVLAVQPVAHDAVVEVLEAALAILSARDRYVVGESVTRPDGVKVAIDRDDPLGTLGRLVQEDICLLHPGQDGHVLTAACLCFPASWTLSEKLGHPLGRIHAPVHVYDEPLAARVQRMFDGLRPGVVLERANCLIYDDFALFQPVSEVAPRVEHRSSGAIVRVERQCLTRLPGSGAVVFSIHTSVVRRDRLEPDQAGALARYLRNA